MRTADLKIYAGLTIVTINGFDPINEESGDFADLPGTANWLVQSLGIVSDPNEADEDGGIILHLDYDHEGWEFSVLVDSEHAETVAGECEAAGYEIVGAREIEEPLQYGDGGGTVAVVKHPDGWIVLPN